MRKIRWKVVLKSNADHQMDQLNSTYSTDNQIELEEFFFLNWKKKMVTNSQSENIAEIRDDVISDGVNR